MGFEKVIPRLDDLLHFLEVLARTSTGQKLTCYTNFINGPCRNGDVDGPSELHLVILDNGRTKMLADPGLTRGPLLLALRLLSECLPCLPANWWPCVRSNLLWTDRLSSQS